MFLLDILLFTFSNLIVLVIIGFITWYYYSDDITDYIDNRQSKIEELITLYYKIEEFPVLFNNYKDEIEDLTEIWDNFIKPIPGSRLRQLGEQAVLAANFSGQMAAISANAEATLNEEILRLINIVKSEIMRVISPARQATEDLINGWNNYSTSVQTGWNNYSTSVQTGWNDFVSGWHRFFNPPPRAPPAHTLITATNDPRGPRGGAMYLNVTPTWTVPPPSAAALAGPRGGAMQNMTGFRSPPPSAAALAGPRGGAMVANLRR